MVTVYKYDLSLDVNEVSIPLDSRVMCVMEQGGVIRLWAFVDTDKPIITRTFLIYGTGSDIKDQEIWYIGTVKLAFELLSFHLFIFLPPQIVV